MVTYETRLKAAVLVATLCALLALAADSPKPKERFEGESLNDLKARVEAMEAAEKAKAPAPKAKTDAKPKADLEPAEKPGPKEQAVDQIVKLLFPDKRPETGRLLDNFAALSQGQLTAQSPREAKAEFVLANLRAFTFNNYTNGAAAAESKAAMDKKTEAAAEFGVEMTTKPPEQ